jgi:hypothetical protein
MSPFRHLSRREFLSTSSAAAAHTVIARVTPLAEADAQPRTPEPLHPIPPPLAVPAGIKPIFKGETGRPLRYTPVDREFVIVNGGEFFNRPLYGRNNDFRVDAGDRPEFSMYLPGHGGNLKFGIVTAGGAKWAADSEQVVSRYRAGRMIYDFKDRLLGQGSLQMEVLSDAAGLLVKVMFKGAPKGARITWAFAGADGRKGSRSGDIGCESVPVSRFFQVSPQDCADNLYSMHTYTPSRGAPLPSSRLHSPAGDVLLVFPSGSRLALAGVESWSSKPIGQPAFGDVAPHLPMLTGAVEVDGSPLYVAVWRSGARDEENKADPAAQFERRGVELAALADTLRSDTPDPYIDAAAAAFGPPADFLWDATAGCVMHGDVAWRARLAGWRGPYHLDALGNHTRAVENFRHWIAMQNVSPITTADPAVGPADPNTHLARKEGMLHSNGDVSRNHYDMNMVFFDAVLRHLRWTGDMDFAKEVWPAIDRQTAWERRLFRRTYEAADGTQLPLYEAYAAIWASDNLQYTGGGTAHSSAYNVLLFRTAAQIARLLQHDSTPYEQEAALIHRAMQELLWLPEQGAYAESKDLYGPQTAYNNPALWTVYHTIDSEVPTPRQAWQIAAERVAVLGRIPVHGEGVPAGAWYLLSCSNWMPYMWSLNLIVLAENTHMALAMWQAGMRDEAFALFKGNVLDSMFMGLCPGDFHMASTLDPHRKESQRDFGDPIGITSRAYVEGLFGIQPNLIAGEIRLKPGFPSDWKRASLKHRDIDFFWHRDALSDEYEITSRFPKAVPVVLVQPARTTQLPVARCNGVRMECSFDSEAVGSPMLRIKLPAASSYKVTLRWSGTPPAALPATETLGIGDELRLPAGVTISQIDDPQRALSGARTMSAGFHTVFANMVQGECKWSMPISFEVKAPNQFAAIPRLKDTDRAEPIDLTPFLKHQVTEMFARPYAEPRSPFCSLSVPDTLMGGWSGFGKTMRVDDTGLRGAGGVLKTSIGVPFRTPAGQSPNCVLLSYFKPYAPSLSVPLNGNASGVYLLLTGTTLPQLSRVENALATVNYTDGSSASLSLRNPETWWPIDQDYMIDDYMFALDAPLPPRVDLATGVTRVLNIATFKGKGGDVEGGAATIVHLPLNPARSLASLKVEVSLYPMVAALLAVTLVRPVQSERSTGE